jgi:hypothetical protein
MPSGEWILIAICIILFMWGIGNVYEARRERKFYKFLIKAILKKKSEEAHKKHKN